MIRRPVLLGGLLLCSTAWPISDASARNRDFEAVAGPASPNTVPMPEPQPPAWTGQVADAGGQAFDAAGRAGHFATGFGDPAAAAGQSLETAKGTHTRHTVRDQLIQNGQIQMDQHGVFRDKQTGKVISRKTLDKTADKLNQFDASMNRTKQSKGWQKTKGALDKLGKFGELGEWSQSGGTAGGEIAGGDRVGAAKTGANHVLSNGAEAAGGVAGAKAGAALLAPLGPQAAVVGGVLGGAAGAMGGGELYDEYGKPLVDAGLNKGAEIYYGDPRGSDAQGRADINAEQANLTPEALDRLKQMERMKQVLTPEAFEVWKKIWGRPAPAFGPPSPADLQDPSLQKALTQIKVGIYESNRDHPDGYGPSRIDPDGALAAAEKAVLDRIAQLEKDVEWEVGEEARSRREWARQDELARLREEQELIAAERARRARDAQQAGQMLDAFGAILGAMGQGMSQQNQPQTEPTYSPAQSPSPAPRRGHMRSDGTWHEGSN